MTTPSRPDADNLERAVWRVLGGGSLPDTAHQLGVAPRDLAAAAERYRDAGRTSLDTAAEGWHQVNIHFADYLTAERTFSAYLAPVLGSEAVGSWWFVRKHPHWRLRAYPAPGATTEELAAHLAAALQSAVSWGVVTHWTTVLYEPETIAFGGPEGLALTHHHFHGDSLGVLDYLRQQRDGTANLPDAKTTSLLAITVMLRAASLELGEQGDVWGQVEHHRPLDPGFSQDQITAMTGPMRRLLLTDTRPLLCPGGILDALQPWFTTLTESGRALADAAARGRLTCGLRTVAARWVLFHWNRMGFDVGQQAIWAHVARHAALEPPAGFTHRGTHGLSEEATP
ncbi:thiopeptide-type bacteriocin biosynthesis protein [Streptacidiphilus sp. MAP5-52]|uniref:thiopeptide-type bacteriocin biosynthesis protein n=1 Tax=Streptacidiphilus sp. MAP5-52 TaxID=3156267 RepID=UPI00351605B4